MFAITYIQTPFITFKAKNPRTLFSDFFIQAAGLVYHVKRSCQLSDDLGMGEVLPCKILKLLPTAAFFAGSVTASAEEQ